MSLKHLAERGQSNRRIAEILGVDESTIRYHLGRQAAAVTDGRARQQHLAEGWTEAITCYLAALAEGPLNLAGLHDWLAREHGYEGSLRSLQRYFRNQFPAPKRRARRRVETPPGAQAQADWAEWPRLRIAGRRVYGYEFHLRLSHSRFGACVWSPRKDQLAWHHAHNEAFRRLEGVPATVRVDNERTAMSRGAGAWGEFNPSYRRYAHMARFHIDPCPPRSPRYKGKVERGIRTGRLRREITGRHWESWSELQAWTDEHMHVQAARLICPATGTSVLEAWTAELPFLSALPILPEPFDLVVTRSVAADCTVAFEGRRYSVPFAYLDRRVEVRGCAQVVQVVAEGGLIAQHPRRGRERILIDPAHYEGESTDRVQAPTPLGRMGRRLQEIAQMTPQQRPMDLYEALAEVAR